jgi:hypothetical protein
MIRDVPCSYSSYRTQPKGIRAKKGLPGDTRAIHRPGNAYGGSTPTRRPRSRFNQDARGHAFLGSAVCIVKERLEHPPSAPSEGDPCGLLLRENGLTEGGHSMERLETGRVISEAPRRECTPDMQPRLCFMSQSVECHCPRLVVSHIQ